MNDPTAQQVHFFFSLSKRYTNNPDDIPIPGFCINNHGITLGHCCFQMNMYYCALAKQMLSFEKHWAGQWAQSVSQQAMNYLKQVSFVLYEYFCSLTIDI